MFYVLLKVLLILSVFIFLIKLIDEIFFNGIIRFYTPYFLVFGTAHVITFLSLPLLATINRKDCVNSKRLSVIMRQLTHLLGLTWDIRGLEELQQKEARVIVVNHQDILDIMGLSQIYRYIHRMAVVSKYKLYNTWPFGLAAYFAGVFFIDVENKIKMKQQLGEASRMLTEEKTNFLFFPEGTRNKDRDNFLPFKKGAFHMAISNQVPILPLVFSPYYFINHSNNFFGWGGRMIITVLPPIPTKGLTLDDVDSLINKVREVMLQNYRQVSEELQSKLPPDYPGLLK